MLRKNILSTAFMLLFVLLAFGSCDSSSSSSSTTVSNISWSEVDQIYNLKGNSTDLKKEEEWKRFKGKKVKWSGEVSAISETFGTLSLQIKMNPSTFTSDLIISLKEDQRSKAINYSEGDRVTFTGILKDWGTLTPISLSDGEIIE